MSKYYSLYQSGKEANINIYGDISSDSIGEGSISSSSLANELEQLDKNINTINVYINSYGGEVAEGIAIYNQLKRHPAKINTYCDSFACSIASVIFMAGDKRIMYDNALLMIHNAWTCISGNSSDFRKAADDLDKISKASVNIYLSKINISREDLERMMDEETWITSEEALSMGFATQILKDNTTKACASAKKSVLEAIKNNRNNHQTNKQKHPKTEYANNLDTFINFIKVISEL